MAKDKRADHVIASSRAQAAIDRAEYFARPGATVDGWRGGRASTHRNRSQDVRRGSSRKVKHKNRQEAQ